MTPPNLSTEYFDVAFGQQQVMAILRGYSSEETVTICDAAWSTGITLVEVPAQTSDAYPSLEAAIAAGALARCGDFLGRRTGDRFNPAALRNLIPRPLP